MLKTPKGALQIIKTLQDKGFEAYLVGGCVRDSLLKKKPEEWDITTSAKPEEVVKLFIKVIPTGINFGTVTILLEDGQYEVTTFRSDERYIDGRHPEKVTFTKNLEDDLSRRDFTINAIAYDPFRKKLIDKFNGRKDLKAKLIRAVGNAIERFSEDGLRPLRACRFAAKLNFKIEKETFSAISQSLDTFAKVAPERIHDEILKLLLTNKPSIGFELMQKSGLLKPILPELEEGISVSQPKPFHKYDVYYHNLYTCDNLPKDKPILRLAGLLHDIAKPRCKEIKPDHPSGMTFYNHDQVGVKLTQEIMKRLKFSNADIAYATNLIASHMFQYTKEWGDAAVRRFMRKVGKENIDALFVLRLADIKAMEKKLTCDYLHILKKRIQKVLDDDNALNVCDLAINGENVMKALNIPPGPKVGQVLSELLEKVLDEPALNQKDKLLELIRNV